MGSQDSNGARVHEGEKNMSEDIKFGLAGVKVDYTSVSRVMPESNSLTYRGYAVQDLAAGCRFEEVAYLIWNGELPSAAQLEALNAEERTNRGISDNLLSVIRLFSRTAHPMDTLRTAISFRGLWNFRHQN